MYTCIYPSEITFLEISSGYDPLVGSFYHPLKLRLRVNYKMTSSGINWKHNVPWIVKLLFLFIASGLREMKIVTGL